jgi:GntR family transcriptional regulator
MSTQFLSAGVPVYHQIAQVLRRRIEAGEWGQGNQLATEQTLCREFGVSRTTVRHALSLLKREGLLSSQRGVGTRRVGEARPSKYVSNLSDPLHANLDSRPTIVSVELVAAKPSVAAFLQLRDGAQVLKLVRMNYLDGEPLSVVESYLPEVMHRAADEFAHRSLHDIMWHDFDLRIAKSIHTVVVGRAEPHVAEMLGIGLGAPVMHVRANTFLQDGRPIRWTDNYFREDRYQYTAEFFWSPPEKPDTDDESAKGNKS